MFLGYLVLVTALAISAVAIFYSVAGLVAIFAAAAVPIMIMGTVLEISKLVTAVWLHKYWNDTVWWLKTYLSLAVFVLMLITSMGIFGYLSKAHIEQTAQSEQSIKEIQQIDLEIDRQTALVQKIENDIIKLENTGSSKDSDLQAQIDAEQQRIDTAYQRIQPAIDEQNALISRAEADLKTRTQVFDAQLSTIDFKLSELATALANNNVVGAQAILGIKQDGDLGPATTRSITEFRASQEARRDELLNRIEKIRTDPNPTIDAAKTEIQRLRSLAEREIADSNSLISRLRSQIGTTNVDANQDIIDQNRAKITAANNIINELSDKKFTLETEYRKLEAEVGPLKYIAEFIYGNSADTPMLEEAVRWVIILIIFVFDPLAVLLLIASQYTLTTHRQPKESLPEPPAPAPPEVVKRRSTKKKTATTADVPKPPREYKMELHSDIAYPDTMPPDPESQAIRAALLAETEELDNWKAAKKRWKDENPELNLKAFKDDYVRGRIAELPWAVYVEDPRYVQNSEQNNEDTLWKRIRERNDGPDNSNNSPG
jgi:hypothetical protein